MKNVEITRPTITWESIVNNKVQEISDTLIKGYIDDRTIYRFKINRVEPFGYYTVPLTADYKLYVDLERIDIPSGKATEIKEVYLGSCFDSGLRELIPFGERYYTDTFQSLYEKVCSVHLTIFYASFKYY